jgi:hypothetical protein
MAIQPLEHHANFPFGEFYPNKNEDEERVKKETSRSIEIFQKEKWHL